MICKSDENGYNDVADNVKLVTFRDVVSDANVNRSKSCQIGHQHPKVVTDIFRLQHRSPTSM